MLITIQDLLSRITEIERSDGIPDLLREILPAAKAYLQRIEKRYPPDHQVTIEQSIEIDRSDTGDFAFISEIESTVDRLRVLAAGGTLDESNSMTNTDAMPDEMVFHFLQTIINERRAREDSQITVDDLISRITQAEVNFTFSSQTAVPDLRGLLALTQQERAYLEMIKGQIYSGETVAQVMERDRYTSVDETFPGWPFPKQRMFHVIQILIDQIYAERERDDDDVTKSEEQLR